LATNCTLGSYTPRARPSKTIQGALSAISWLAINGEIHQAKTMKTALGILLALTGWGLFLIGCVPGTQAAEQTLSVTNLAEMSAAEIRAWAEKGEAAAQNYLGAMYSSGKDANGKDVLQDFTEAVKWFRKAADANFPLAQLRLGEMYKKGQGIPADMIEAIKWFRKAAEHGDADAQYEVGMACYSGLDVPKDLVEAYKWLSLGAAAGNVAAGPFRNICKRNSTPEQLAKARRLVEEFKPAKEPSEPIMK
jgi:hypothetical protein